MTILIAEGFDTFSLSSAEGDFTNLVSSEWSWVRSHVSYGMGDIVSDPVGSGDLGRVLRIRVLAANHYGAFRHPLPEIKTELVMGAWMLLGGELSVMQPRGGILQAMDATAAQYVEINVVGDGTAARFEVKSTLSGETATDTLDEVLADNWEGYVELVVQGGNAQMWINSQLRGQVSVGGTIDFAQIGYGSYSRDHASDITTHIDHTYVTDFLGTTNVGRLGPVEIIPLIPTAEGTFGTDFAAYPGGTPKHETVDDNASSGVPNTTDYVEITGPGVQTFTCTAEKAFTGSALAYSLSIAHIAAQPTEEQLQGVVAKGGSSATYGPWLSSPVYWKYSKTGWHDTLPDGAPLTQANLEATDFGVETI